ncbi:1,25-dihydroxyvitamin D(3) 24-hydroxylase, mitochondrial [Platysternon megacephalum]|uniref:1,25-dihydroxyvitamin D(3) 24-hydroxylase, mitochondrial n=1 Tax=Platysternon megacephalum TaxID=55544 RepID=A0A4D9ERV1_9SAUR|nr:1,25-dihydroxyvitamin D(3) 24-hydroxylase, mitochondrial [Platysternon megacephalum]
MILPFFASSTLFKIVELLFQHLSFVFYCLLVTFGSCNGFFRKRRALLNSFVSSPVIAYVMTQDWFCFQKKSSQNCTVPDPNKHFDVPSWTT